MADKAPITPAAPAATFDAAQWLSHFESIGGGFLATESQTSLCIACHGTTPDNQSAAHAMLRDLTDEQRAGVIAHIRAKTGLSDAQPDLKAVCSQEVSETAGISPSSSGSALDNQSEGQADMDMTHAFILPKEPGHALDWGTAMAKRNEAEAASDRYDAEIYNPAWEREKSSADYIVPDELHDHHQRLIDEFVEAESVLMNMPAPDGAALTWKLDKLLEPESEYTPSWSMSYARQTIADYHRLLPDEIAAPTASQSTRKNADTPTVLAGLPFEPIKALPKWTNDEWASANLPSVRIAAVVISKTKSELHEAVKGLIESEILDETLDHLTDTKEQLEAMASVIDSALLRQFVVLEELGFTPDNPPAHAA